MMYADDARGSLVYNMGGSSAQTNLNWVADVLDWFLSSDNTNTAELTAAALGPYVNRSILSYHCPADRILTSKQAAAGWSWRARSYSMNASVGDAGAISSSGVNSNNPDYVQFFKLSSIPHPSAIFVFIEEHPNSITDGYFVNRIDYGYKEWLRLPASYHNGAAALSFADGHTEFHRWQLASTKPSLIPQAVSFPVELPANQESDFDWLADRMTVESH
jgi:prepilin-type processing-associated H-X9-DG protein